MMPWARLAFALLLAAADRDSPGYADYRRANDLFVAKQFPAALAAVEAALRRDPRLVPALTLHAKMAMSANQFDAARADLEHALAADPASGYAQFLYGLNFYLANDLANALPALEKARGLQPSDARAALYLGLTCESLGRASEAMTLYEEAARLERNANAPQPETLLTGARLLLTLGRLPECDRWLREALALAPGSRECHFELARLLLREGHPAQAAKEGEQALRLRGATPSDAQLHFVLIRAYRDSDPDKAAQHATALRALQPAPGPRQ